MTKYSERGQKGRSSLYPGGAFAILCAILLWCSLFYPVAAGTSQNHYLFDFADNLRGWSSWGDGRGTHVGGIGHNQYGSITLACSAGQQQTIYQNFKLSPGRYRVSGWLRSLDVGEGEWNQAIWLFYQTGSKIVSPVTGLHGTFEWSRFDYTLDATERPVDIWFRLKAPGTIWLDDIVIEPYKGEAIPFRFEKSAKEFPKGNPVGHGIRCPNCYRWMTPELKYCLVCGEPLAGNDNGGAEKIKVPEEKLLIGFETADRKKEEARHRLRRYCSTRAVTGTESAVIQYGAYNNLEISDRDTRDWRGYDYFEIDIYNPLDQPVKFALSISDDKSKGYWEQLNHYSNLNHGWNHLKFEVNRYVGERGSVRVKRYLDLGHISRVWFAVAPEEKKNYLGDFLVDTIRLTKAPILANVFPDLYLFDFVADPFHTQRGFTGIETRHNYSPDVGFGFVNSRFWRTQDSLYADSLYRDGIYINEGTFRVDLPNGRYVVRLVPNGLGVWYEHFWTRRTIKIQGRTVLQEEQRTAGDYLKRFLQFSDIEPRPEDNPYDLYLGRIFKEIITVAEVRNGRLEISCSGDDSAIMLNSLIIYPVSEKVAGENFVRQLHAVQRDEFSTISRRVESAGQPDQSLIDAKDRARGFYSALIDSDVQLRYNQILPSKGDAIYLSGGKLQRPIQALMVRNLGKESKLQMSMSALRSPSGEMLPGQPQWLRYGVAQFQSHTSNHETYELAPRFLRNFPKDGIVIPDNYSLLLWLQIPISKSMSPGPYLGSLDIVMNDRQVSYPVSLEVLDFILPEVDFAVGFFGLDPVEFSYFSGRGVDKTKTEYRQEALRALRDRGFSTWSGLPPVHYAKTEIGFTFDAAEVDELMSNARSLGFDKKVFTYGGASLVPLEQEATVSGVTADEFRRKTGEQLRQHMAQYNWLPVVCDISDEATGYSQKVDRDTAVAEMMAHYYPFLRRGGYSQPQKMGEAGYSLNLLFTDISLSSITDNYINTLKEHSVRWGLYNQAIGLFQNNRYCYGKKLFELRQKGCDHYLEWYSVLAQNYPYYDLDGRENDAMMFFPRADGHLDYALKLEWAALGLEEYRLLLRQQGH